MKTSTRSRRSSGPGKVARPSRGRGLIGKPVGRGYNSDPDDVVKTKAALERGGYYRRPRGEPLNPYPDREMVEGIGRVQRLVGERPTGAMRPGDKTERVAMAFLAGGSAATPEAGQGDDGAVSRFGAHVARRGVAGRKGETGETLAAQALDDWSQPGLTIQPPFALPQETNRALADLLGNAITDLIENPSLPRTGFIFPREIEDDDDDEGDEARHPLDFSNLPWRDECQAQYEDDIRNCEHWSSIAPDGLGPSVFERCERIAGERLGQCVQGRGERPATALPFHPRTHRWRI